MKYLIISITSLQNPLRFLSALMFVLLLASCQTTSLSVKKPFSESPEIRASFADNTATYKPKSDDAKLVLAAISRLKRGYETFDVSLIKSILHKDFDRRELSSDDKIIVESGAKFLKVRSAWTKTSKPVRELRYAIGGIAEKDTGEEITVIARSTYASKYFNPRFLETLIFEKTGGDWLLKRQVMVLLNPKQPEGHAPNIFVGKTMWGPNSLTRQIAKTAITKGPDWVVEQFRKNELNESIPEDEIFRSVLVVFREPVAAGTEIAVEHQWSSPGWVGRPAIYRYYTPGDQPFLMIENRTATGGPGNGNLTWRVRVTGVVVAEKTLRKVTKSRAEVEGKYGLAFPNDLNVVEDVEGLPEKYKRFLGRWGEGEWNQSLPGALIVEQVDGSGAAVVVFAIAKDLRNFGSKKEIRWRIPARWDRIEGKIGDDGKLRLTLPRTHGLATFRLKSENQINGSYRGPDGKKIKIKLRKIDKLLP